MDRFQKLVTQALKKDAAGTHPDPNLLAAFAENVLPRGERQSLLDHLGSCSDCRDTVYLSLPQPDQAQTVMQAQPRRFRLLVRWGAAAASMAILAFVFGTRYAGRKASPPAPLQMAAEQQPQALDRLPVTDQVAPKRDQGRRIRNARPLEKHMTAKPEAKLRFDESGEVHVAAPVAAPAEPALSAQLGKKKEDLADAKVLKDQVAVDSSLATANGIKSNNKTVAGSGYALEKSGEGKRVPAAQNLPVAGSAVASAFGKTTSPPQWRLAPAGGIERSADSGKTWTPVSVARGVALKALSVTGTHVWAGGKGGVLYHSQNAGADWVQVKPEFSGQKLSTDISRIEFSDPMNGDVTTLSGETWTTSDGGNTWSRR